MNWSDIADKIKDYAPLIATALNGPIGTATAIGTIIAREFGADENSLEDVVMKMDADPNREMKLREIESTNKLELEKMVLQTKIAMRQAESEDLKTEVDDRKSARQKAIELAKTGVKFPIEDIIAVITVIAGFIMLSLYTITKTAESKEIVLLIGALITQVFSYYYGSSKKY